MFAAPIEFSLLRKMIFSTASAEPEYGGMIVDGERDAAIRYAPTRPMLLELINIT